MKTLDAFSLSLFQRSAFLLVELGNLEDSFEEDEDEIGNLLPIGKVSK